MFFFVFFFFEQIRSEYSAPVVCAHASKLSSQLSEYHMYPARFLTIKQTGEKCKLVTKDFPYIHLFPG